MIVRRLLIALAVLIALTAIAAGVSPRPGTESGSTPQAAPAAGGVAEELDLTLSTTAKGAERDLEASVGDTVRLTVEGDEVDSVELGDLEIAPLDPDSPAVIELLADDPGRYPIRLLDADREIGTLEIVG
jgi:hypothetical protein